MNTVALFTRTRAILLSLSAIAIAIAGFGAACMPMDPGNGNGGGGNGGVSGCSWTMTLTATAGSSSDVLEGTYTGDVGTLVSPAGGLVIYGFNMGFDDQRQTGEFTISDSFIPGNGSMEQNLSPQSLTVFRAENGQTIGELATFSGIDLTITNVTDTIVEGSVTATVLGAAGTYDLQATFRIANVVGGGDVNTICQ